MSAATHLPVPVLSIRLRAALPAPSILRASIREWLWELGAPDQDSVDLQLACSEALNRIIDQAARPVALVIDVDGRYDGDMLTVTIREYGLCRDADWEADGHETLGLVLIQAMVDVFDVQAHPGGRTITLGRRTHCLAA